MREQQRKYGLFIFFIMLFTSNAWGAEQNTNILVQPISTAKKVFDLIVEGIVKYSFQVLAGIIILFIGWMIAKFVTDLLQKFLNKKNVDVTICKFLIGGIKVAILGFAALLALGKFGIEIAPFIAGISVAGVGISLALQGLLSNYAAGISLIFTKPFKVGDIIEVGGQVGEVQDMTLPRTVLKTIDGTIIFIPNKHIVGEIIHNFSAFKLLEIKVGISYKSDIDKAIQLIKDIVKIDSRILKNPEPKVGISEIGASSLNIYARLRCHQADYWDVMFNMNRQIFAAFHQNGIEIPFPQQDVHVYQAKA